MSPTDKQSFGLGGCVVVPALGSATGVFCAIQFITEGGVSAITSSSVTGDLVGITFPAGFTLYLPFTAVTTTAGTEVIAYRASQ